MWYDRPKIRQYLARTGPAGRKLVTTELPSKLPANTWGEPWALEIQDHALPSSLNWRLYWVVQ